jgi:hypothetical protein
MKIYDVSLGVNKAIAMLSPKRVFIYASVLALLTHIIILALYIHVPRFRESPGEDFVQFYGAAILSREQPDKIYDTQSQMDIQTQFSAGAQWNLLAVSTCAVFYRAFDAALLVFLCRRVLALDSVYDNAVFRIGRTTNPLGASHQTTAACGELSCGWCGPGPVLADLNGSNDRDRSMYLDDGISIHEARPILLVRLCFGLSQLPSPVFDDHYPIAGSAQNVVGNVWL